MKKLQCIIIEDEPLAAEVLTDYVRQVPFLQFTDWCIDAVQAMDIIRQKPVDVIFLDLHLPGIKGFDFLKTLTAKPQVIITTAYHEYALQGYEWQVVDYLVKPIEFSRFLQAANKLKAPVHEQTTPQNQAEPHSGYLYLYADKKQVKVDFHDIVYAESQKDYLKIRLKQKTIVVRHTMQELERALPPGDFIRIHRSYVIASSAIDAWTASSIEAGGRTFPIGRNYREQVMKILRS